MDRAAGAPADANDISPAWSSDGGRLAFLRVGEGRAELISVPSSGGHETRVAEFAAPENDHAFPQLSWSRDGRTLATVAAYEKQPPAIALVSLSTGAVERITTPPEGSEGDWSPVFSPDGAKLAFTRGSGADSQDIYVADAKGANPRRVTFDECAIRGLAWMPNRDELVYAATRNNRIRLWRVTLSAGSPREVIGAGVEARFPTLSLTGGQLVYTESPTVTSIWQASLDQQTAPNTKTTAEAAADTGRALLRSNGSEKLAAYSPDGRRIADISDQTGFEEAWISDADGGNRAQISNFAAAPEHPSLGRPVWSPDGKWLLLQEMSQRGSDIGKLAAAPGSKPVRVAANASAPEWAHDGKSIYFSQRGQIWKAAADGSTPKQLTERGGTGAPAESPDGKFVYYRFRAASIWRVPSNGGEAEPVMDGEGPVLGEPEVFKDGLYYLGFDRFSRGLTLMYYDFAARKASPRFSLPGGRNFNFTPVFSISPDGKYALYTRADQARTNLMLVEGFR